MLDFVIREIHVECLPADIPKHLSVDVAGLHLGQHVEVKDLQVPDNVLILDDAERVIASVGHHGTKDADEAAAAEPEVIKKTKGE